MKATTYRNQAGEPVYVIHNPPPTGMAKLWTNSDDAYDFTAEDGSTGYVLLCDGVLFEITGVHRDDESGAWAQGGAR
jgi:hypothetical protein